MLSIRTFWMGVCWWLYVATEKYILNNTAEFHVTIREEDIFNGLGILCHFILVFFVSGCFTMVRFGRNIPPLRDIIFFALCMCLISSLLDLIIGVELFEAGTFLQLLQWYVLAGYAICVFACILFSRDFSLSFRSRPVPRPA